VGFLVVRYLYLEKTGLSRNFFQLFFNLFDLLTNIPIFNCVIFRNGNYEKGYGLIFISVGQMTQINPISYSKWGIFTGNLPRSTTM
jgi:hypothetical protein